MREIHWLRLFRRGMAAFLAVMAVWLLALGMAAGAGTSLIEALGQRGDFVTAVLRLELGELPGDRPPLLLRLALAQSPLLAANPGWSADLLSEEEPSQSSLPNAQPAPDRDDLEAPKTTAAPGDIVERTLVPTTGEGYVTGAGLYLYNRSSLEVDLAQAAGQELSFSLSPAEQGPQILIIHTHTTEAYTPDGADIYEPSDENSRTLEEAYNMLRVGDEMEKIFTEMGLGVIHDRGFYDYPKYNGAYTRSGPAVEEYLEQYPTIRLVLDVHRDALIGADGTVYKVATTVDGVKAAQVMVVVGTDNGDGSHPNWTENLALATRIQKNLDTLYPTLARPMALRGLPYNQELSVGSLLVEVGSHGNTLQEALAGARCFARAAGGVFLGLVEEK